MFFFARVGELEPGYDELLSAFFKVVILSEVEGPAFFLYASISTTMGAPCPCFWDMGKR
jgi:hypothetical protein